MTRPRLPELLLMRADKMSMATSVEARVPFLDHKLVEFALNIPDHIKYKNNETKYILKKACEGIIPKKIIYRKKVGFAAPIVRWLNPHRLTCQKRSSHKNYFLEHFKKSELSIDSYGTKNSYHAAVQKWVLHNYKVVKEIF